MSFLWCGSSCMKVFVSVCRVRCGGWREVIGDVVIMWDSWIVFPIFLNKCERWRYDKSTAHRCCPFSILFFDIISSWLLSPSRNKIQLHQVSASRQYYCIFSNLLDAFRDSVTLQDALLVLGVRTSTRFQPFRTVLTITQIKCYDQNCERNSYYRTEKAIRSFMKDLQMPNAYHDARQWEEWINGCKTDVSNFYDLTALETLSELSDTKPWQWQDLRCADRILWFYYLLEST